MVNTDSNSAPGLGLRLLIKSLRVHWGQPPPTCGLQTFIVGEWSQRVIRVKLVQCSRQMPGEQSQHRNGGTDWNHWENGLYPKATQFSFFLCVSGTYPSPNPSLPEILLELFRKEMQCRLGAWQRRASGNCQGWASVAPKANAMREMLGPAKMAFVGCERDSAEGHWQLFSRLPWSHPTHSLPVWLQHPLSCHALTRTRVSASQWDFVYFPLKRTAGFLAGSYPPRRMESPPVLTAQCYESSSSWHWCSGLLSPAWGWDPPLLFFCKSLVIRLLFS